MSDTPDQQPSGKTNASLGVPGAPTMEPAGFYRRHWLGTTVAVLIRVPVLAFTFLVWSHAVLQLFRGHPNGFRAETVEEGLDLQNTGRRNGHDETTWRGAGHFRILGALRLDRGRGHSAGGHAGNPVV